MLTYVCACTIGSDMLIVVLVPFLFTCVIPASISYIVLIVKIKWKWKKLHGTKNFEHNSILPCTWCSNIMHIWCTKKYVSKIRYEHTHAHTNTDIYRRNINELCGSKSIYDIITWWCWWLRFFVSLSAAKELYRIRTCSNIFITEMDVKHEILFLMVLFR